MKKYQFAVMVLCITLALSGCGTWLTGSYASVKPHEESHNSQSRDSLEASDKRELESVLLQQVKNGQESCVVYVTDIESEQLDTAMQAIVHKIRYNDPIGAFAVEKIEYDIGTSTGRTAIAVQFQYNRSRSEILRIKTAADMDGAFEIVAEALEDCDAGAVVLVEAYEEVDIIQKIQDFVDANPGICMEMPQVSQSVYPQSGTVRVLELNFSYQSSREVLRQMQVYVQPVFSAAVLNASAEEDESVRYARMYAFLMERMDYKIETSITPAYSLLRHGVGDSKAFATVYAAMCKSAELECYVISGTREGEPWFWNMICQDDVYYHVDLLRSNASGKMILSSQEDMTGYVWDYSAYPEAVAPKPIPEQSSHQEPEATSSEEDTAGTDETAVETTLPQPTQMTSESTVPTEEN